jgi:excisionase family DNA binding protein
VSDILQDYVTPEALAEELGVSPRTLKRWRLDRVGPAPTKIGRKFLYRRDAVKKWLEKSEPLKWGFVESRRHSEVRQRGGVPR